jgi:hypothetical protein
LEWESARVAREAAVAELERIDEAERLKREAARALR